MTYRQKPGRIVNHIARKLFEAVQLCVACPHCRAQPGEPCITVGVASRTGEPSAGLHAVQGHRQRRTAAHPVLRAVLDAGRRVQCPLCGGTVDATCNVYTHVCPAMGLTQAEVEEVDDWLAAELGGAPVPPEPGESPVVQVDVQVSVPRLKRRAATPTVPEAPGGRCADAPVDAAPEPPTGCTLPPPGWRCTRERGHDGPCVAWPNTPEQVPSP